MKPMIVSKRELAEAFEVSLNTISNWAMHGLPCRKPGGPGRKSEFVFDDVASWLYRYSDFQFANYMEPDQVLAIARQRARAIVNARNQHAPARSR